MTKINASDNVSDDNDGSGDNHDNGEEDGKVSDIDEVLQQPAIGLYNTGLERDSERCQTLLNICRRPTATTTNNRRT